jgi:hypothetical protein
MERAIVVRGRLADPRHIELDEPVTEVQGSVEVVLRATQASSNGPAQDVFELIAELPAGRRSKEEIDREISHERSSWRDP